MPRFFLEDVGEKQAVIEGEDAAHIARSLRMQPGDEITLSDLKGSDYDTVIQSVQPNRVVLTVVDKYPNETESKAHITLYQALPKSSKLDFIVQKAVEMGASRIVPVLTQRCISRPKPKAMQQRLDRLNRISLEAAKQSQRGIIPQVAELLSFEQALEEMTQSECPIILYENSERPLSEILTPFPKKIAVMVGSEGGFASEEIEQAVEKGVHSLSLGKRILRCETAPIAVLSAISYAGGEF